MTYRNVHASGTAHYPQVQLEWAPTTQPTAGTQTYVDITTRLREWSWGYGRNDELGEFDPGRGYVILDNRDRAFDPSHTGGTWYGKIKPRRAFRMKAKLAGVEYGVFVAYARGFPQTYPAQAKDAVVRVDLVDRMADLATYELPIGFSRPVELSGPRIDAVLDAIGVPAGQRSIMAGTVMMAAIEVETNGTSALAHIRDCAQAEFGQFYDVQGTLIFSDRTTRLNYTVYFSAPLDVIDKDTGDLWYDTTFEPVWDDTYLWNDVRVDGPNPSTDTAGTATGGTTSLADYWHVVKTLSTQLAYEPDRTALAQYHALRYAQPAYRTPTLSFSMAGQLSNTNRASLLGLGVNTAIDVTRSPFSGGSALMLHEYVEGVAHSCRPGGPWTVTLAASPADENRYWTLELGSFGTIDSNNLISP